MRDELSVQGGELEYARSTRRTSLRAGAIEDQQSAKRQLSFRLDDTQYIALVTSPTILQNGSLRLAVDIHQCNSHARQHGLTVSRLCLGP